MRCAHLLAECGFLRCFICAQDSVCERYQNNHVEGLHSKACQAIPTMVCLLALHIASLLHLSAMESGPAHGTQLQASNVSTCSPLGQHSTSKWLARMCDLLSTLDPGRHAALERTAQFLPVGCSHNPDSTIILQRTSSPSFRGLLSLPASFSKQQSPAVRHQCGR